MIVSYTFLFSALVVIMSPGPDSALLTRWVLRSGRRSRGYAAAAGMVTGATGHATLAVTGVAGLLQAHPDYVLALRVAGAAGLFCWGVVILVGFLRSGASSPGPDGDRTSGGLHPYWQGLLCTGSNPKVGIFLLAFLPQFLPAGTGMGGAVAVLAAVYITLAALWLITLTEFVYRLRRRFERPGLVRLFECLTAVLFIGFSVRMALGA